MVLFGLKNKIKTVILELLRDPEIKKAADEYIQERIREGLKKTLRGLEQDKVLPEKH